MHDRSSRTARVPVKTRNPQHAVSQQPVSRRRSTRTIERPRNYMQRVSLSGRRTLMAASALPVFLAACQDGIAPDRSGPVASPVFAQAASSSNRKIPDEYIVVLSGSVDDVSGRAKALLKANGGTLNATYTSALTGFSAHLSAQAAAALAKDPSVAY